MTNSNSKQWLGFIPVESIANEIKNIRDGEPGKVVFNFRGEEISLQEPDELLVGFDDKAAALWLAKRYGYVLSMIGEVGVTTL